jgi:hypothetical protein
VIKNILFDTFGTKNVPWKFLRRGAFREKIKKKYFRAPCAVPS